MTISVENEIRPIVVEGPLNTIEVENVVAQVVISPEGLQGPPGLSGAEFSVIAAMPLGGQRAVTGAGVYADQATIDGLLGITLEAATTGAAVRVRGAGTIDEPSWSWTPNVPIYVGASGVLTQTPPAGIVRRVAFALSATRIVVDIFPPIQTA